MKIKTLTVSDVNNYVKKNFDNDFILNNLSVEGEISNLKYHSSGHIYFSLKDSNSKINAVMFRSDADNLKFKLENGMLVKTKARLSIYIKEGTYQLYCRIIEKSGLGDLYVEFERLKEKLNSEGLFDFENKKNIPKYPKNVGVVTSPTGAAIEDILNVIKRRNKHINVHIYPALVQGVNSSPSIIRGIEYFNKNKSVDVIIVGRGGGSIEELWAFNDENLAYSIYKSKIPIISAVGHEVDYTISDFVADLRASTPSVAAELVSFKYDDFIDGLFQKKLLITRRINDTINREKDKIGTIKKVISLNSPLNRIVLEYNRIDNFRSNMNKVMNAKIKNEKEVISKYKSLLDAHNPLNILDRGYSIIEDVDGKVITNSKELDNKNKINIIFRDGNVKGEFIKE